MILIIDNRSMFIRAFEKKLIRNHIPYKFNYHQEQIKVPDEQVEGIILSGGAGNPFEPLNLTADFVALINFNVPTIGFCLGHEIVAVAYGAKIAELDVYQNKYERIFIDNNSDLIFQGIEESYLKLKEQHQYHVSELPSVFKVLAHSEVCPFEIIKHKNKPLYGFQSHPEISGKTGNHLIHNFLQMCNPNYTLL